jgi:phospholipid/cholesterol/gamma-HCH transport system substrate-binding protein
METRGHYVAVGAFVLTIVFLALVAVLWLGRFQLSTQYNRYDIYFTGTVTGLSPGAPVNYAGIRVGQVVSVRLAPGNVEQILVEVEIEAGTIIKADAVAGIETNILSGVSTIQITGGTNEAPVLLAEKGHPYPVIPSVRSRLERVYARLPQLLTRLSELAENLNNVVDEHNRKALAAILDNLRDASGSLASATKGFPELTDEAKSTLSEAKTAISDAKGAISDAKGTLKAATTFVENVDKSYSGRDGLKDQLTATLADFDHLAKGLIDTNRGLQAVIQDARPGVRDLSQRTVSQLNDLIGETRQLVSGLSRLASQIERDPARIIYGDRREGYRPR